MMIRRQFITLMGGAAIWPAMARAQQAGVPVIGFLHNAILQERRGLHTAFLRGLAETGYVDGRNVSIAYRWAEYHNDRLPTLALELVRRRVDVIAVGGTSPAVLAAKAATQDIPIVFMIGGDPVRNGLVASLARPGGNCTGFTIISTEVVAKRIELLHELVPAATAIGLLINQNNPVINVREVQRAAGALGIGLLILNTSGQSDIERALATLAQRRIGALLISTDSNLFPDQTNQIVALAARLGVPAMYERRESAVAGGLNIVGMGCHGKDADLDDTVGVLGIYRTARQEGVPGLM